MTKPNIKPLGKRILIQRAKAAVTKGGIYLPDSAQEKPKQGEVIAVGPGSFDEQGTLQKVELQVGDLVLFSSYAGTPVKGQEEDQNEYLVMSEDEVLAVIN